MKKQTGKRKPNLKQRKLIHVWNQYSGFLGIIAAVFVLLTVFAVVTFADSQTAQLGPNDQLTVICEGRGFQLQRVSRKEVDVTCVAGANSAPTPPAPEPTSEPTGVPPIDPTAEPPVEPTAVPPTSGAYYVALNGDDNQPGTEAQPFRTIQKAVDVAAAGETVFVRGGVYNEQVIMSRSGTAGNPITLAAYPNETPVLDGEYELPPVPIAGWGDCDNSVTPPKCFHYEGLIRIIGNYIIVDGFEIRHSLGRGVTVHNRDSRAHDITVRNMNIHDVRSAGIQFIETDNILFENSQVWHSGDFAPYDRPAQELNWAHAVNAIESSNVVYRNNTIFENHGEGLGTGRGSSNVLAEGNTVYDNMALNIYIHRTQDVVVRNNIVYCTGNPAYYRGGNTPHGIVVNNEENFTHPPVDNAQILNNLVTGCRRGVAIWAGGNGVTVASSNVTIAHNTLVNQFSTPGKETAAALTIREAPHQNIRIENNLIFQPDFIVASIPSNNEIVLQNNVWSREPIDAQLGEGDVVGDPSLTNPNAPLAAGQVNPIFYQLTSQSIAIDVGTNLIGENDFFGTLRDASPDSGFHEFQN